MTPTPVFTFIDGRLHLERRFMIRTTSTASIHTQLLPPYYAFHLEQPHPHPLNNYTILPSPNTIQFNLQSLILNIHNSIFPTSHSLFPFSFSFSFSSSLPPRSKLNPSHGRKLQPLTPHTKPPQTPIPINSNLPNHLTSISISAPALFHSYNVPISPASFL